MYGISLVTSKHYWLACPDTEHKYEPKAYWCMADGAVTGSDTYLCPIGGNMESISDEHTSLGEGAGDVLGDSMR